jgi:hypothetical protein
MGGNSQLSDYKEMFIMELAFSQSVNQSVNQSDSQSVGVPFSSLSFYAFSTNCIFWSHFSDKAGNVSFVHYKDP